MVDLHTHILPGIDDGPENYEQSIKLIEMEMNNGVDTVALTPHFYIEQDEPARFLEKRDKITTALKTVILACGLEMRLIQAAEVRLSPELVDLPSIKSFCYAGTGYMLVELPMEYFYDWIPKILFELRLGGITPVLAHVERYPYFHKSPQLLADIVCAGSMAQLDASSFVTRNRCRQRFVNNMLRHRLVQVIATDTHSVEHRPPRLGQAMLIIEKNFGGDMVRYLEENSKIITTATEPVLVCR